MIYALRHPALLLGLLLGFLIGVALRAAVQRRLVSARGVGRARMRAVRPGRGFGRPALGWAAYLDPYGAVAAVLAGPGWGARVDPRSRRGADVLLLVAAAAVHAALAAAGYAAYVAAGGHLADLKFVSVSDVLHGSVDAGTARNICLGFGAVNLACGVLAFIPIPPLELGVILWSRLPRTPGARRVAYRLLDEPWGVAVILVLLLLRLGGSVAPLIAVIDAVGSGIFGGP